MTGCPLEGPDASGVAGGPAARGHAGSSALDYDAIRKQLDAVSRKQLPPFPDEAQLCQLRFTHGPDSVPIRTKKRVTGMSIDEVRAHLGPTDQESQAAGDASLIYQYTCPTQENLLCGVSANFLWLGNNWFATEDKYTNYYLTQADVRGVPRPLCWPHIDQGEAD